MKAALDTEREGPKLHSQSYFIVLGSRSLILTRLRLSMRCTHTHTHTHEQQQKCGKPARARRLCHSGMTRSDGEVSASTPQGSDSVNGWEDETLAALHPQDLGHFMTLTSKSKPSP